MAIDQAWSGIRDNISVNSAHVLGDRTSFQDPHSKRWGGITACVSSDGKAHSQRISLFR